MTLTNTSRDFHAPAFKHNERSPAMSNRNATHELCVNILLGAKTQNLQPPHGSLAAFTPLMGDAVYGLII